MSKFFKVALCMLLILSFNFSAFSFWRAKKSLKIGVAMPTKSLQRWNQDGAYLKEKLEAKGFQVDLQYANNDVATQISQLENMITKGCKVLVIASIDGTALKEAITRTLHPLVIMFSS